MVSTILFALLSLQCVSNTLGTSISTSSKDFENIEHSQQSIVLLNFIGKLSILLIIIQSSGDIEQIFYSIVRLCLPSKSHPTLNNVIQPLSSDEEYPMVGVQLPMMNEIEFCISMITCACNLDWPKSRLIIQVLDDSTDEIVMKIINQCVQEWSNQEYQIDVVRRENRQGFKAGNLKNGLKTI